MFTGLPLTPTDTLMQRISDKLHRNVDKITRKGPSVDSVVRSMGHGLYENSVDRFHVKYLLLSIRINTITTTTTASILFD